MLVLVYSFILNYFLEFFVFVLLVTYPAYSKKLSKMSKAITDAVAERRLRPIYGNKSSYFLKRWFPIWFNMSVDLLRNYAISFLEITPDRIL